MQALPLSLLLKPHQSTKEIFKNRISSLGQRTEIMCIAMLEARKQLDERQRTQASASH